MEYGRPFIDLGEKVQRYFANSGLLCIKFGWLVDCDVGSFSHRKVAGGHFLHN
ncbi:hypothetical protein ACFWBX_31000 [Streptomyces sp. NPDC059991]|uniref:hypothetical protein n=1 Tax=Streptomyces sp. NPDC059991 TaxID=3347028 RepID=UPI0036BAB71F